jgi:hypothetical protein
MRLKLDENLPTSLVEDFRRARARRRHGGKRGAGLRTTTHVEETSTVTTTSVQRANPASAVQNSLAAYSIAVAK